MQNLEELDPIKCFIDHLEEKQKVKFSPEDIKDVCQIVREAFNEELTSTHDKFVPDHYLFYQLQATEPTLDFLIVTKNIGANVTKKLMILVDKIKTKKEPKNDRPIHFN